MTSFWQGVLWWGVSSSIYATQVVFYQSTRSVFNVTQLVFYFQHSGQIAIYIGKYKIYILYCIFRKAICPVFPK